MNKPSWALLKYKQKIKISKLSLATAEYLWMEVELVGIKAQFVALIWAVLYTANIGLAVTFKITRIAIVLAI